MSEDFKGDVSYTPLLEKYFANIAEKCQSYAWLHTHAEAMFSKRSTQLQLPVIVASSIIGFLSAGSNTLFEDAKMASIALGVGSLIVSILQTISAWFNFSKRAEGHRIGALQFSKLHRWITVQMGLPREQRIQCGDLLKMVRENYDRLNEVSPMIPPESIHIFKSRFSSEKYAHIARPSITNGLEKVTVYNPEKDSEYALTLRSIKHERIASEGSDLTASSPRAEKPDQHESDHAIKLSLSEKSPQ